MNENALEREETSDGNPKEDETSILIAGNVNNEENGGERVKDGEMSPESVEDEAGKETKLPKVKDEANAEDKAAEFEGKHGEEMVETAVKRDESALDGVKTPVVDAAEKNNTEAAAEEDGKADDQAKEASVEEEDRVEGETKPLTVDGGNKAKEKDEEDEEEEGEEEKKTALEEEEDKTKKEDKTGAEPEVATIETGGTVAGDAAGDDLYVKSLLLAIVRIV